MGSGSSSCNFEPNVATADGVSANSPVNRSRFAMTAYDRLRILEQYRRIATRYEKRADNFLAMLLLAAIIIWL